MPTLKTTDVTNVRESLSDIISMLSPTETPFMSSIAKTDATAVKTEFLKDDLAPANKDNAAVEGADAGDASQNGPTRLSNYCQIFVKPINVSRYSECR
ncbi:SU10 major capsid protein [Neorhizobium alkalisoli]|uniref:Uncharacterized protein n=1 Tax=Neorhizobium alkalisoli TaxID=528178 RepID=A0A561Q7I1_9HYPH|nr:DUF5309 family protein [Neorhizobium alkalisoli]TWF46318.1 hypothetical protein FHW37_11513 [Neorhizobium alkalisoli]